MPPAISLNGFSVEIRPQVNIRQVVSQESASLQCVDELGGRLDEFKKPVAAKGSKKFSRILMTRRPIEELH